MPLYTKCPSTQAMSKYRLYYEPFEQKWHYEHRRFAVEVVDIKYLVHHKDLNPANNNPDNLLWCSRELHKKIHDELVSGCNSEEARLKKSAKMLEYHKNRDDAYLDRNHKIKLKREEYCKNLKPAKLREEIPSINAMFEIDFNSLSKNEKCSYRKQYYQFLKDGKAPKALKDLEAQLEYKKNYVKETYGKDWDSLTKGEKISFGREYANNKTPLN